ncbi:MAG: hypothetical protein QXU18_14400 [Thermoplasmatales archaeon]
MSNEGKESRLKCSLNGDSLIGEFSLVDYRNNYFTSEDPNKIIEFYNGFKNREQLIQWMKDRPKGMHTIYEVEGDKDIIVVITTADYDGKYAKECRENIFKGLHIIFVESGGRDDFYFNIAHNINVGIAKAMEYNPKWIVFSGDDMYKIDVSEVLVSKLRMISNVEFDFVYTYPSLYHSHPSKMAKPNVLYKIYYSLIEKSYKRIILELSHKFGIKYIMSPISGLSRRLFKRGYEYLETLDFGIYSSKWVREKGKLVFDETFINAAEDLDLSLHFSLSPERTTRIDYKIGDMIGTTLGVGELRDLRNVAGIAYLNYKWLNFLDKIIDTKRS